MKINPDSQNIQNRIDAVTPLTETSSPFGVALAAKIQQLGGAPNATPLTSIAQAVTKADLADPSKADAILDHAVQAIIDKEFGNMRTPDRQQVAAWLHSDPVMRQALLKHITSLAS
jgi:hypothetical protein